MVITGVNCTVTYFALKGNFKRLINNEEFKYYSLAAVGSSIMISILIYTLNDYSISSNLTEGFFMVPAIGTSTDFVASNYTTWTPVVTVILFWLMFMSASAIRTSGGVKEVRHLIHIQKQYP